MKRFSFIGASALVLIFIAGLSPRPAQASDWDRLTYFTFNKPVEVPGVRLPAGTYIFKLASPDSSSNVVQVSSRDGRTVYSSFFAIPESRLEAAANPTVTFYEPAAGSPRAIRTWFNAGERDGLKFVYTKEQPTKIVSAAPSVKTKPLIAVSQ